MTHQIVDNSDIWRIENACNLFFQAIQGKTENKSLSVGKCQTESYCSSFKTHWENMLSFTFRNQRYGYSGPCMRVQVIDFKLWFWQTSFLSCQINCPKIVENWGGWIVPLETKIGKRDEREIEHKRGSFLTLFQLIANFYHGENAAKKGLPSEWVCPSAQSFIFA